MSHPKLANLVACQSRRDAAREARERRITTILDAAGALIAVALLGGVAWVIAKEVM